MKKTWSFVKKDLLQIMRDREGYIWLLIMPIVFMLALSFATAPMYRTPGNKGAFEVSFLLVNQDSGSLGQKLVMQIGKMANLKPIDEIAGEALTAVRARQLVDQKDYGIALIIPDNFSAKLNAGEMIEMDMYRDPATTMPAGLLRKIVEGVAKGLVAQRTAKAKVEDILIERGIILDEQWKSMTKYIEGQIEKAIEAQPRVNIREIAGKSRRFPTVYEQNVPAMTVMFAFFGITTLMFSVLSEHELGTFRRLASAPVSRVVIILGKVIPPAIVTYVQVLILFLFGYIVFGIQPGNIFAILLITLGLTMAVTGMASFLSTFVKTKRQAGGVAYTISLPLAALGGCMVPAWVMPETMRNVARITPHYWAMTAYQDVMVRGLGVAAVILPVIVLLGFGFALMALGVLEIQANLKKV